MQVHAGSFTSVKQVVNEGKNSKNNQCSIITIGHRSVHHRDNQRPTANVMLWAISCRGAYDNDSIGM